MWQGQNACPSEDQPIDPDIAIKMGRLINLDNSREGDSSLPREYVNMLAFVPDLFQIARTSSYARVIRNFGTICNHGTLPRGEDPDLRPIIHTAARHVDFLFWRKEQELKQGRMDMTLPEALCSRLHEINTQRSSLQVLANELASLTSVFVDLNYARMDGDARRQAARIFRHLASSAKDVGGRSHQAGSEAWQSLRSLACQEDTDERRQAQNMLLKSWLFPECDNATSRT